MISKCFIVIFSFIILLLLFFFLCTTDPPNPSRSTANPQQPPITHGKPSKAHQITPNPLDPITPNPPDQIGEIASPTRPPQSLPRVADHCELDPIGEIATQHDPAKLIAKPRHHCEAYCERDRKPIRHHREAHQVRPRERSAPWATPVRERERIVRVERENFFFFIIKQNRWVQNTENENIKKMFSKCWIWVSFLMYLDLNTKSEFNCQTKNFVVGPAIFWFWVQKTVFRLKNQTCS